MATDVTKGHRTNGRYAASRASPGPQRAVRPDRAQPVRRRRCGERSDLCSQSGPAQATGCRSTFGVRTSIADSEWAIWRTQNRVASNVGIG